MNNYDMVLCCEAANALSGHDGAGSSNDAATPLADAMDIMRVMSESQAELISKMPDMSGKGK